jgi:putative toxin-antitoxin system antitoxin component (TIGR02293 family)
MATHFADVYILIGVRHTAIGKPLGIADTVENGLPVSAVERIARAIAPDDARFKYRIVPKTTLERRRKARGRLTSEEGDRVARLAKAFAMAISIYRDEASVAVFMRRPHMLLEGKTPRDVALATDPGADAVVHLLGTLAHGGVV